jgi:hypothetical protein
MMVASASSAAFLAFASLLAASISFRVLRGVSLSRWS